MALSLQEQGSVLECFGCGSQNPEGYHFKSYLEGETATLSFTPNKTQTGGGPDYLYGGLIASIIDCHSCNLAIGLAYGKEARAVGSEPRIRFVTAQLNVTFKEPTPIDQQLTAVASVISIEGRKTWVRTEVVSGGVLTAVGEVLCVRVG